METIKKHIRLIQLLVFLTTQRLSATILQPQYTHTLQRKYLTYPSPNSNTR